MLEIIIERNKDNKKFLREDAEIQILFTILEETARREKRSFYESRMAHYYACLHDPAEAVLWAEKAVETTPFHVPVLLNLARIQIDIGDTVGAKRTLDRMAKIIQNSGNNTDRRNLAALDKVTIQYNIQLGDFSAARRALDRARSLPRKLREVLTKKIEVAEAYKGK